MAIVYTDTIEPRKPTQDITLGTTGETITLPGNDLRVNTVKDKGGNTLWTSDGSGNLSSVDSQLKGSEVLILSQTASNSASISFTADIDSTYKEYVFMFVKINPATDSTKFQFNLSIDGGSNYNRSITSTYFHAYHNEAGTQSDLGYQAANDQASGSGFQILCDGLDSAADLSSSGVLYLANPASTTYVKTFIARMASNHINDYAYDESIAGFFNTTSAVDAIQFKMTSGNFDGTITMYGIK